jgi:hypothetical protein
MWAPALPDEDASAAPKQPAARTASVPTTKTSTQAQASGAQVQRRESQSAARPSLESQMAKQSEAPPLPIEDPAQRRARENAPRMYSSTSNSSNPSSELNR